MNKDELADIETWDRDRKAKEKTVILANKIEITCRSKNQKDVIKSIEKNIITAVIGEAGCLTKNEKIRIYRIKPNPDVNIEGSH